MLGVTGQPLFTSHSKMGQNPRLIAGTIASDFNGNPLEWSIFSLAKDRCGMASSIIVSDTSGRYFPTSSRSEEHTSEIQSLMRISYDVFCLKKNKKKKHK